MPEIPQRWRVFLWALLLFGAVAAAYGAAALRAGYVHDDFAAVVGHPQVRWPVDLPALARARYFGGADYAYVFAVRPLATASYAAEVAVGLDSPLGRHLTQLVLLLATSALLAGLLWRWGQAKGWPPQRSLAVAGLASALFAVHPVHTEAVMAVAYRPELLAALALLIGSHLLLSLAAAPQNLWRYIGLFLAGLAALWSKESAAAGLVWWALWALADRPTWQRLRLTWLPIGAALATWLAWRVWAVGALIKVQVPRHDNPLAYVAWPERLLGGLDLTGRALLQLLFPAHLAPDYTFDAWPTPTAPTLLAGLGLAALGLALGWALRHWARQGWIERGWIQRGWVQHLPARPSGSPQDPPSTAPLPLPATAPLPHGGWLLTLGLLGSWLPVSHLLIPGTVLYADRLLTVPSMLLGVAAAVALQRLPSAPRTATAAALLMAMVGQTQQVSADWTSPLALFERGVRLEPRSLRMRLNLAHELTILQQPQRALPHAQAALALDPADPKVWVAGLDAALAARDCRAAEPFAAAVAASDKKAATARLAALAWGMECRVYARAWPIARRLPSARLTTKQALDLYALAHAAGDLQGAMALAQRLGVDVARQPAWVAAAVYGQRSAGRPLQALTLLADLHRRQPSAEIVRQAQEILAGLATAADREAAARIWPPAVGP